MSPEYERLRALGYKTFAELEDELATGKVKSIDYEEFKKARHLERALLPPDVRFPQEGDVYIARGDTEVAYVTTWELPYTGGGKGILPENEKVVVLEIFDAQPVVVACRVVRYRRIEAILIPEADRKAPAYSGYYLSVPTLVLHRFFELAEGG